MRAIASLFLFLAAAPLGCSPDLGRLEGTLELEIRRAPPAADRIRAIVQNEQGSVVVEVTRTPTTAIAVERTPGGLPVEVRVEALAAGTLLEARTQTTTLVGGVPNRLIFDFDQPPIPSEEEYAGQAQLLIEGITVADESGGTLTASVLAASDPSFTAFLAAATSALGAAPIALEIDAAVHLELLQSSTDASRLRDVWGDEPFSVALTNGDGTVRIELGETSGRVETRAVSFSQLAGDRRSLAALQDDLVTGNFRVVISGPSRIDAGSSADVRVTISFTAFAPGA